MSNICHIIKCIQILYSLKHATEIYWDIIFLHRCNLNWNRLILKKCKSCLVNINYYVIQTTEKIFYQERGDENNFLNHPILAFACEPWPWPAASIFYAELTTALVSANHIVLFATFHL